MLAEWADDGESTAERPVAPLHRHLGDDEASCSSDVAAPAPARPVPALLAELRRA